MGFELVWLLVALVLICIGLLVLINKKIKSDGSLDVVEIIQREFRESRNEVSEDSRRLREEVNLAQKEANETVLRTMGEISKIQKESLTAVENRVTTLVSSNETRLEKLRETIELQMKSSQLGNEAAIEKMQKGIEKAIGDLVVIQKEGAADVEKRLKAMSESNEGRLDKLRETVNAQLSSLQESNDKKLEQMRNTVDEKLQSTLNKRLGESFKMVSERLEAVQHGLGDMQNLATGVGDLKRMLTNVKARGTWAEFQLGDILEQILTVDQYKKNVHPVPKSSSVVEYAIRLPGQDADSNIWLPIDSKFPQEDYIRLLDATEISDSEAVEKSKAALLRSILNSAKDISEKYVHPPYTTDFAIMFLPTEGLYSEVLRQPGMVEKLQQDYRVVIAGPTTLSAILNSLRMGFRTLAIEKRSSEVWKTLAKVKTEFGKFGEVMDKVKKQLETASKSIDQTGTRTRAINRSLKDVEALPYEEEKALPVEQSLLDGLPKE